MARRKDHTHDEIREQALNVLMTHLEEAPADATSLRQIARQIGYSPGTLINIFGSYDQLLLSANARTLDLLASDLQNISKEYACPLSRLKAFACSYLRFAEQYNYQWQLLFQHRLPEEESVPEWQLQRINDLFAIIEQALSELATTVPESDLQQASRTIWASVHGICSLSLDDKLFAGSQTYGESMLDSLISHYVSDWRAQYNEPSQAIKG
ncbi:TetR/AcrR family transcriptional regulator [Oceanospirillum sediminis]|uniref:TetR/AcrR family transcriptional regulator n=1 Tax=Oceanospirillum sediminis TaxID=2760088 RepID=A0A839IUJ7_9GAMM|nr:TetR/AcrR family transcriptional regulator [Oceanospirillum sediminis]MBB1489123.1 TetR/AcrR family transcriptional regulator [Oceanospirillum sediminis]